MFLVTVMTSTFSVKESKMSLLVTDLMVGKGQGLSGPPSESAFVSSHPRGGD